MADSAFHRQLRRAVAAFAAVALAATPVAAAPGPGPQPYYGVPIPAPPPFLDPFAPAPTPPRFTQACDGSEPIFGGILGASAGGLLAAVLSERHGRADPGATVFGVITGAMIGATLAANHCPPNPAD